MSTLYVVGTPIGNLGDLSPRAAEILGSVDFIAAEDTRVTRKLLTHFGIQKPLVSYYDRQKNRAAHAEAIVSRVAAGESCALVTDAGMPAVSDPGEELVRLAAEQGVPIAAVPGPSAAITALALSGLPCARFTFEGFLPSLAKDRRRALEPLRAETRTMIFYEAPHRLCDSLCDLRNTFGETRRIALCRELTKLHEEVLRLTLGEAVSYHETHEPRGEYVLIVEGAPKQAAAAVSDSDAVAYARSLLADGLSPAAAAKEAARTTGVARGVIYRALVGGEDAR
jgi:16S rRNA (cytidine1402-2'-O)-methyltransferase